jgi:hypothetical protein
VRTDLCKFTRNSISTLNNDLYYLSATLLSRNVPRRMRGDFSLVGRRNLQTSEWKKSQVRHGCHFLSFCIQNFKARNNLSHEAVEDQDIDPLEYGGGEFDEDEHIESVRAARDAKMKKLAVSVRGKVSSMIHTTAGTPSVHCLLQQMTSGSVKIVEPAPATFDPSSGSSVHRPKKEKYTLASLPFPRGAESMTYTREWRKSFKPTLIQWAATLEDPFGSNAVMGDIITEVWMATFPSIANEVVVGSQSRPAIIHLVISYHYWQLI